MAHFYDVFYVQVDYVGQFVCLHFGYMCVFLSAPPEFGNSQCVVKTTHILYYYSKINSFVLTKRCLRKIFETKLYSKLSLLVSISTHKEKQQKSKTSFL